MKTITRESYAKRIERVVDYLIDHLDGDVDLHRLAQEAFMSPYHFHRIYHAMTGETVAETVRRLRLHRAAVKLISSDTAISALAAEAGYRSVQAFGRAFRDNHGAPPAAYRAAQARQVQQERKRIRRSTQRISRSSDMFEVTIRKAIPHRVVALPHRGEYMKIGNVFQRLALWATGRGLMDTPVRCFAIYYDDPAATPVSDLRSDACLSIPAVFALPAASPPSMGGCRVLHTPAGRCAVLIFKGPYSNLEKPYQWLFGEWLPNSGEEPDDQPCFEEYLNDARSVPPAELLTAICVPLKD